MTDRRPTPPLYGTPIAQSMRPPAPGGVHGALLQAEEGIRHAVGPHGSQALQNVADMASIFGPQADVAQYQKSGVGAVENLQQGNYGQALINALDAGLSGMGLSEVGRAADALPAIFVGPAARSADHTALAEAQSMEQAKVSNNQIFDDTGWFRGVDDNWRFEIPDTGLQVNPKAPVNQAFSGVSPPAPQINIPDPQSLFAQGMTPREIFRNTGMVQRGNAWIPYNPQFQAQQFGGGPTPPVVHPQLAAEYDMSGLKTKIDGTLPPDTHGQFEHPSSPGSLGKIGVAPHAKDPAGTAAHELQHVIQRLEGFQGGGNSREPGLKKLGQDGHHKVNAAVAKMMQDPNPGLQAFAQNAKTELDRLYAQQGPAYFAYYLLAGEAEARNAGKRAGMWSSGQNPGRPWDTQDVPGPLQIRR
jgi:hypothetical protein